MVGSSSSKCSVDPFAFGSPWDEVYDGCCKDIKQDTFILNEDDESEFFGGGEGLSREIGPLLHVAARLFVLLHFFELQF